MIIRTQAFARIGWLGNPSDGYFGKTISCSIRNFAAEVTLWESPTLQILPNRVHDATEFDSLHSLAETAERDGYYGGLRLLFATAKKFYEYCSQQSISLPDRNFTISYETNIPRQVGLGGSSAIITAAFKALMQFFELTDAQIPKPMQPNVILSVETEELDIAAGLQDRVIQVYGGTVYMDFAKELMHQQGYGNYEYLDSHALPRLFLAYIGESAGESGKVHSNLRYRWQQGEREVLEAVSAWASFAEQGKDAILRRDEETIARLMNANFDLRRKILGDDVIGRKNLEMVEIARRFGLPAKFSGSGGAIVGMFHADEEFRQLHEAYRARGYECVRVEIAE
jgi:glucuronokinase